MHNRVVPAVCIQREHPRGSDAVRGGAVQHSVRCLYQTASGMCRIAEPVRSEAVQDGIAAAVSVNFVRCAEAKITPIKGGAVKRAIAALHHAIEFRSCAVTAELPKVPDHVVTR